MQEGINHQKPNELGNLQSRVWFDHYEVQLSHLMCSFQAEGISRIYESVLIWNQWCSVPAFGNYKNVFSPVACWF